MLERLWKAGRPLGVREVSEGLSGKPRAYTTMMTILTRLVEKDLVRRIPAGRTFLYEPCGSQEELAARAIREVLRTSRDPEAVLARFVEQIADDPELMRRLADLVTREAEP